MILFSMNYGDRIFFLKMNYMGVEIDILFLRDKEKYYEETINEEYYEETIHEEICVCNKKEVCVL